MVSTARLSFVPSIYTPRTSRFEEVPLGEVYGTFSDIENPLHIIIGEVDLSLPIRRSSCLDYLCSRSVSRGRGGFLCA
jgi:hypothetical protein